MAHLFNAEPSVLKTVFERDVLHEGSGFELPEIWRLMPKKEKKAVTLQPGLCGCGVIGSRARLRILCLRAWGFESLHPHKLKALQNRNKLAGRAENKTK